MKKYNLVIPPISKCVSHVILLIHVQYVEKWENFVKFLIRNDGL